MRAPASVVAAVQEALRCEERGGKHRYCYWHGGTEGLWTERGCSVAVRAADAAWAAAYPAALRDAAGRLPEHTEGANGEGTAAWPERHREVYSLAIEEAQGALRRWADESEAP